MIAAGAGLAYWYLTKSTVTIPLARPTVRPGGTFPGNTFPPLPGYGSGTPGTPAYGYGEEAVPEYGSGTPGVPAGAAASPSTASLLEGFGSLGGTSLSSKGYGSLS